MNETKRTNQGKRMMHALKGFAALGVLIVGIYASSSSGEWVGRFFEPNTLYTGQAITNIGLMMFMFGLSAVVSIGALGWTLYEFISCVPWASEVEAATDQTISTATEAGGDPPG